MGRQMFLIQSKEGSKEKMGVILTLKVESLAELKFDPGFRVIGEYLSQIQIDNLTLNIESIWLKYSTITRNPGSNFSSASDSTFKVKMTPFLLSVRKRKKFKTLRSVYNGVQMSSHIF